MASSETVKVRTADVELRTCRLTKSILKQMPVLHNFGDVHKYLPGGTECQAPEQQPGEPSCPVIGWIHGQVMESGDDWGRWLVIRTNPGDYALFKCLHDTAAKYKQIFVL